MTYYMHCDNEIDSYRAAQKAARATCKATCSGTGYQCGLAVNHDGPHRTSFGSDEMGPIPDYSWHDLPTPTHPDASRVDSVPAVDPSWSTPTERDP